MFDIANIYSKIVKNILKMGSYVVVELLSRKDHILHPQHFKSFNGSFVNRIR